MKITTKTRYGIRALLDLAIHDTNLPISLHEIAQRQNISLHYLEQIVSPLVRAGILTSTRGINGGVKLSKPPEDINLMHVFELLEGRINLLDCTVDPKSCLSSGECATRDLWQKLEIAIKDTLFSMTLKDLADQQQNKTAAAFTYQI